MRKIFLLVLLHILVLGGIWLWRSEPDVPVHPGDPARISMTGQETGEFTGGEILLPGLPPVDVDINGPARMSLWIYLPEHMLQDLDRDSPVSIRMPGEGEEVFTGRVAGVDTASRERGGETHYRVLLELDPEQGKVGEVISPE